MQAVNYYEEAYAYHIRRGIPHLFFLERKYNSLTMVLVLGRLHLLLQNCVQISSVISISFLAPAPASSKTGWSRFQISLGMLDDSLV